jgi:hypothetical protein
MYSSYSFPFIYPSMTIDHGQISVMVSNCSDFAPINDFNDSLGPEEVLQFCGRSENVRREYSGVGSESSEWSMTDAIVANGDEIVHVLAGIVWYKPNRSHFVRQGYSDIVSVVI